MGCLIVNPVDSKKRHTYEPTRPAVTNPLSKLTTRSRWLNAAALREWLDMSTGETELLEQGDTMKSVHLGTREVHEAKLIADLEEVKRAIEEWGVKNELWHDTSFQTPFTFHNEAPRSRDTLLLISEGPLGRIFGSDGAFAEEYQKPFTDLLDKLGFWFENENHYTMSLYPTDDKVREDYLSLYRWQWLKHLAEKKVFDLHGEIFEYFAKFPGDLQRLHWREFEELLDAIFKNQGYRTELGPGRNDGGVDLRIYQHQAIPEVVTLVQAKKYKDPIGLEPVTSIFGIAAMERARKAMLATTSYFEPKARAWALSTEQNIDLPQVELADAPRISGWCAEIGKYLNQYFSNGLSTPPALKGQTGPLADKIVVAHGGYNCTQNFFAMVEADFPHEAILRPLGDEMVSGDGTVGTEVPSETAGILWTQQSRLLASKEKLGLWVERKYFRLWDGTPQYFNSD